MSEDDLSSYLANLDCEGRYDFSLTQIAEERVIWILINSDNQFLKLVAEDESYMYLPIWPSEALAQDYARDDTELTPKGIMLPAFFKKWVSGLERDGMDVGIFPGQDATVWVTPAATFKQELQDELAAL